MATPSDLPTVRHCRLCGNLCSNLFSVAWDKEGNEIPGTAQCDACDQRLRLEEYDKDGLITTRILMDAFYATYDWDGFDPAPSQSYQFLAKMRGRLGELIKKFDQTVWLPPDAKGLCWRVNQSTRSGMSAPEITDLPPALGIAKFMTMVSAGRCMLQVEAPDGSFVSMLTEECPYESADGIYHTDQKYEFSVHRMGLQGIKATAEVATSLLTNITAAFELKAVSLDDDTQVGFGFGRG